MTLQRESKLSKLVGALGSYEASGVTAQGGSLYVVFDNATAVAVVDEALTTGRLGPGAEESSQYEGITVNPAGGFYAVRESASQPRVDLLDADGRLVEAQPVAVALSGEDGHEGIAAITVQGQTRLLALCEEDGCGEGGGRGTLHALRLESGQWAREATVKLPAEVAFGDFSDLALAARSDGTYRAAVLSQKDAAIWVGTLSTEPWAFAAGGTVYSFPSQYCSLEGVSFLPDPQLIAVVSDRDTGSDACKSTDESIHLFRFPSNP